MAQRIHEYGQKLAAYRGLVGYTQRQMAMRIGDEMECEISPSTVANYEAGFRYFEPAMAAAVFRISRIDFKFLGGPKAEQLRDRLAETRKRRGGRG